MNISYLRSKDFLWYWLPPLAWCGTVLLMSGDLGSGQTTRSILEWLLSWLFPPLPPDQFQLIHFYVRKSIGHFGNYAFLYFWWFRALRGHLGWRPGRSRGKAAAADAVRRGRPRRRCRWGAWPHPPSAPIADDQCKKAQPLGHSPRRWATFCTLRATSVARAGLPPALDLGPAATSHRPACR